MRVWCLAHPLALLVISIALADDPPQKFDVVTPKDDEIIANAINERGEIVGFEWVEEKDRPGVVSQQPFFAKGKEITYLPILKGYTATFPAALSDEGVVVGRVSKPIKPGVREVFRNQAFLWSAKDGIRGLGAVKDDIASFACGITRDGRRISGYSVGENRIRACVWERDGDTWSATALPHAEKLTSFTVAISGDGKYVTAGDGPNACLWTRDSAGTWTRDVIAEVHALTPRAVNNRGSVVGVVFTRDGLTHASMWSREKGYQRLEEPKDYVRSEASAINNEGVVVGSIDGAQGSNVTPRAFAFERGQLRILDEGGPNFAAAQGINEHRQVTGVMETPEKH
jgi:uncharacterized membrane protein